MTSADKVLKIREKALRDSIAIFEKKRMAEAYSRIDELYGINGLYNMFECIEEELFEAYENIEQYKEAVDECIDKKITMKEWLCMGE